MEKGIADKEWDKKVAVLKLLARGVKIKNIAAQVDRTEKWVRDLRSRTTDYPASLIATLPPEVQDYLINYLSESRPKLGAELENFKQKQTKVVSGHEASAVEQARVAHWGDLGDMARRMTDMVVIPSPCSFWVFDLGYGEYHGWEGYGFQWFCRPDNEGVEVSFLDFGADRLLERETFFQPLMSHLPDICEQYEKLKALTGEYIRKCHQLLSSIVGDARQAAVGLAEGRVSDTKQLQDFLNAKASEKALFVEYDDKGAVILYRDFATTVYDDAVVYAEYKHEQTRGEYVFDSGWGMLRYGYYDLAMGSDSDMKRLLDVHKELRVQYCQSPLVKDLLDCYHDVREVQHDILTKLHMIILKRVFPGSCDLCPNPQS